MLACETVSFWLWGSKPYRIFGENPRCFVVMLLCTQKVNAPAVASVPTMLDYILIGSAWVVQQ